MKSCYDWLLLVLICVFVAFEVDFGWRLIREDDAEVLDCSISKDNAVV
jgi:hypothetical protein